MDSKSSKDFLTGVNEILTTARDQDLFLQSLRQYRSDNDLDTLVCALTSLVQSPERLPLFEAVRPLIPVRHQLQFDRKTHRLAARLRVRVVRLSLRQGPLGFAFRGGVEHGVGCFVSHVAPNSAAAAAGLRPGDEILRVNGFPVAKATHEEAAALIRSRPELVLKVKRVGMIPKKERREEPVSWEFSTSHPDESPGDEEEEGGEIRLFVNARGASLGCTIFSGPPHQPGIFVHSVQAGGLAEQAGLRAGDQLIQVNGVPFGADISHSHAVMVLKARSGINMAIRRGQGLKLLEKRSESAAPPAPAHQPVEKIMYPRPRGLRTGEVHTQVTRHRNEDEVSADTAPSGSATPTREEAHNGNIIFRTSRSVEKTPASPVRAPDFSVRETGGRQVEVVRVSVKPGADCGLQLEMVPGGQVAVAGVEYGSSGFQADARMGDFLLAVDGEKVVGLSLDAVQDRLVRAQGQPEFRLTLARAPEGVFTDEITYF